jgi:hypothetical protein
VFCTSAFILKDFAMSEKPIGYKRPPEGSQFKKGMSGNPSGRPKNPPSIASDVAAVLQALTEHGGRRMSVQRALILRLVEEAIAGEPKDRLAALRFLAPFVSDDSADVDPRAAEDAAYVAELERDQTSEPEASADE